MEISTGYSLHEKLHILADAAKYDVACTSSGVDRRGRTGFLGNSKACGICHSFSADGRCISLLKVLQTNHCVYDCKYCINRASNDIPRTAFTPEELCELTIEFYKRNYIEGLFLSSGVQKNPTYTMEQMCETLQLLRTKYRFNGYIHVKTVPGASEELITRAGYLADRMSINLELPTAEGMKKLAPNKSHRTILGPMKKVTDTIAMHRLVEGKSAYLERSVSNRYLQGSIFSENQRRIAGQTVSGTDGLLPALSAKERGELLNRPFAQAGQSTQMIIGATQETDYHLLKTTQALYQRYDLKRVFFSAYVPLNEDKDLPSLQTKPPLLREHRLYQADWLLRFYGFQADELLSETQPNFNDQIDPKCDWALRHLELFPVEVNTAAYEELLRIPGIGPKSVARIIQARRYGSLDFDHLKKMGVVLKRAHYFITCHGKTLYPIRIDQQYILRQLTSAEYKDNWKLTHQQDFRQMSLFSDFGVQT